MNHIGEDEARQCLVCEVALLQEEKDLKQNPSIFSLLPCHIYMYTEDNRTVLATLKPTTLLAEMFHTQQLPEADQQMEDIIIAIMKQATGG